MRKEWEWVLGVRVLFTEETPLSWMWEAPDLAVQADPAIRFPSMSRARLAAAVMVYGLFVIEEVTSTDVAVEEAWPPVGPAARGPAPGYQTPHGSGG
jgi:hypothetical protein